MVMQGTDIYMLGRTGPVYPQYSQLKVKLQLVETRRRIIITWLTYQGWDESCQVDKTHFVGAETPYILEMKRK
jgi:hypothetical protein